MARYLSFLNENDKMSTAIIILVVVTACCNQSISHNHACTSECKKANDIQ